MSVTEDTAINAYYASKMNIHKHQVLITLNNDSYTISQGAMQWMAGNVKASADVKGVGDFFGKTLKGAVTKESAVKPRYQGTGYLMLEPTFKYLFIEDVSNWQGGLVLDDGLFLACQSHEGFFNLMLSGNGLAVLESPVPREELIEIDLQDDEIRIDGNYAIAWSGNLEFKVEKSTKNLVGSAVSGEGLVNVYRGTGKILIAPLA